MRAGRSVHLWARAYLASESARSFHGWPEWALTCCTRNDHVFLASTHMAWRTWAKTTCAAGDATKLARSTTCMESGCRTNSTELANADCWIHATAHTAALSSDVAELAVSAPTNAPSPGYHRTCSASRRNNERRGRGQRRVGLRAVPIAQRLSLLLSSPCRGTR